MDNERYELTSRFYDLANDKLKVDGWINTLEQSKKNSEELSSTASAKLDQLKEDFTNLSIEEQGLNREQYGEDIQLAMKPLFDFHSAYRKDFRRNFNIDAYDDIDIERKFFFFYDQFTMDFKG
ncbi:MAG: hypothetical protein EOO46_09300 [Flavobacterium sp.]|nr:MAG: hypothetical protein EOO46_09300 [Flavobacterium sp.]